jgi:WD40 repeat protein
VFSKEPGALSLGVPSPDGERLAASRADSSIEVRRTDGPPLILKGHKSYISDIEFSRDHALMYSSSYDGTLRRWDLATGEGTILVETNMPVRGFVLASDLRVIVQVGKTTKILFPDGTERVLGVGPKWCMAGKSELDPVSGRLMMRRCDASFALVDLDSGNVVELSTGGYPMIQTAISPDGSRVAGALTDRTVRIWDATTGDVLQVLRGHTDLPLNIAFSPDGTRLASSSYDKTIRIWQLGTQRARVLRGHSGPVYQAHWLDGAHVATGSRDGTIRIWDVPVMDLPTAGELAARIESATTARIDLDRPTTGNTRRGT